MPTALLIIDVQHALCTGEEAAFDIDRVIERINSIGAKARAAGAPVFVIQHEEDRGPLQFGADGWQLAAKLATTPGDIRVRKTTPDSFHRTELHPLLEARGITRLVVCGLQSDFCVDTTIRRALALGYNVVLVADAHSTVDNGVLSAAQIIAHHNTTLAHMSSFGPRVTVTIAGQVKVEAESSESASAAAGRLGSLLRELRDFLVTAKQAIDDEIHSYPTPIPRCDAQFNFLYEQRSRLANFLNRTSALTTPGAGSSELTETLMEFVASSPFTGDRQEQSLRERIRAELSSPDAALDTIARRPAFDQASGAG